MAGDPDYIPVWLKYTVTLIAGGAGVRLLATLLEHMRLSNEKRRNTMSSRIRELETRHEELHDEIEDLRADVARLETENHYLESELDRLKEATNGDGPG